MGWHSREEQRSFTHAGGEECFVYARDRRQPGVPYFLEDVPVTDEVRAVTRESLECPVPGCASPRLKVVNRKRKRNGFSHLPGAGGHADESMWHTQAKLMLLHWVHTRYPECHAALEVPIGDRERVADVLVTFPGGQQVALEVQYSAEPNWQDRHASYQRCGITDVWLLGHRSKHLILDRDGQVTVTTLHREILQAGLPLLWVNPDGRIGTGHHTSRGYKVPPDPDNRLPLDLAIDPLDKCVLTPSGLRTPTLDALTKGKASLEALRAEEAAARARAETLEAARAEQRAKDAKERERRSAYAQKKRETRHAAWQRDPLRKQVIDTYRGVPEPLAVSVDPDGGVFADPEHWHTVVYRDLIHRKVGTDFTIGDVYRCLTDAGLALHPDPRKRSATIVAYLEALHYRALIRIHRTRDNPDWITGCTVLLDLDGYKRRCDEDRRRTLEHQEGLRQAAAEHARAVEAQKRDAATATGRWDHELEEWDGTVNRVQHYFPGTSPVLRWHERVLSAIRDHDVDPTPAAVRQYLGGTIAEVPDPDFHLFLGGYRPQVAESVEPWPGDVISSHPPVARPLEALPDALRLF